MRGYWVRVTDPFEQIKEVLERFDLSGNIQPFTRCLKCNILLTAVEKLKISDQLEPRTKNYYHDFLVCSGCHRIYWRGSHYQKMKAFIRRLIHVE